MVCAASSVRETQSIKLPIALLFHIILLADEDDLRDVISAVVDLAERWQDLGISLRLRQGDLKAILTNNAHCCNNCLREMLTLWLKQNYKV